METAKYPQERSVASKVFSALDVFTKASTWCRRWQIDHLSAKLPDTTHLPGQVQKAGDTTVYVLGTNDGKSINVWHDRSRHDETDEYFINVCRHEWSGDFTGVTANSGVLTNDGKIPTGSYNTFAQNQEQGLSLGAIVRQLKCAQRVIAQASQPN